MGVSPLLIVFCSFCEGEKQYWQRGVLSFSRRGISERGLSNNTFVLKLKFLVAVDSRVNFVSIWQLASGSTTLLEVLQLGPTSKESYHGHIPPDENTVMETGCARLHKAWLTEGEGLKKAFECNSSNSCSGLLTLSTILFPF